MCAIFDCLKDIAIGRTHREEEAKAVTETISTMAGERRGTQETG